MRSISPTAISTAPVRGFELSALLNLAVECWRFRQRCERIADDRRQKVREHFERVHSALAACGLELRDPLGEAYHPGMSLDILASEGGSDVVIETVRPAVYFDGRLQIMAQVILGPRTEAS